MNFVFSISSWTPTITTITTANSILLCVRRETALSPFGHRTFFIRAKSKFFCVQNIYFKRWWHLSYQEISKRWWHVCFFFTFFLYNVYPMPKFYHFFTTIIVFSLLCLYFQSAFERCYTLSGGYETSSKKLIDVLGCHVNFFLRVFWRFPSPAPFRNLHYYTFSWKKAAPEFDSVSSRARTTYDGFYRFVYLLFFKIIIRCLWSIFGRSTVSTKTSGFFGWYKHGFTVYSLVARTLLSGDRLIGIIDVDGNSRRAFVVTVFSPDIVWSNARN